MEIAGGVEQPISRFGGDGLDQSGFAIIEDHAGTDNVWLGWVGDDELGEGGTKRGVMEAPIVVNFHGLCEDSLGNVNCLVALSVVEVVRSEDRQGRRFACGLCRDVLVRGIRQEGPAALRGSRRNKDASCQYDQAHLHLAGVCAFLRYCPRGELV